MNPPGNDPDAANAARHYAWEWFKLHAMQRMTVFNLFLIITGAIITGFITATINKHYEVSLGLSVLELIVVSAFFRLDQRNAQLVKIGEDYLKHDEAKLASSIGSPLIRLADAAERKPCSIFYSFRQVLQTLFGVVGILAFIGVVLSISAILADDAATQAQAPRQGGSSEGTEEP